MLRLEQLCVQYLETCIGLKNVLVALQNASKMNLDFLKVRHSHAQCTTKLIYMYMKQSEKLSLQDMSEVFN